MLKYQSLAANYKTSPPKGFIQYCRAHGATDAINTCGVRLAYAILLCDKDFFKDVTAKSKTEWYGLPSRASDLAIILNEKVGKPERMGKADIAGKKGIVFFDTIPGFGGTGHISLWDGTKVVDGGDYFSVSPRVYFWSLPD
jgi:hypothetical protein